MLRAIETMTWLFEWLSDDDRHGPGGTRNYTFFSALRGMRRYPFEYRPGEVVVLPRMTSNGDSQTPTRDELLTEQYTTALGPEKSDPELLIRMSFNALGMDCAEGPPANPNSSLMLPRFLVSLQNQLFTVFCLEFDLFLDSATADRVVAGTLAFQRQSASPYVPLVVIHHQKHLSPWLRETEGVMPASAEETFCACGLVAITTTDLYFLVNGLKAYKWNISEVQQQMMRPGRQAMTPPGYCKVGLVRKVFPSRSVISVELTDNQSLGVGDVLGLRLQCRWHEEIIESLQVNKLAVEKVIGPVRVGISIRLKATEVSENIPVFRCEKANGTAQARDEVAGVTTRDVECPAE